MTDAAETPDLTEARRSSLAALMAELFGRLISPDAAVEPNVTRWRVVLGLSEEANIYLPLAEVQRALDRLDTQINDLPAEFSRSKAQAADIMKNFRAATAPQYLHQNLASIASFVTRERVDRLYMLADILDTLAPESLPPGGAVPIILEKISSVAEAVENAPFPSHIKKFLRERVDLLRWAVVNWHLVGSDGVSDAVGALTCAIKVHETQDLKAAVVGVLDWIGRYLVVLEVAGGTKAFIQGPLSGLIQAAS